MPEPYERCPHCGHHELDPRKILIGLSAKNIQPLGYKEIFTLKCQNCGWLGEHNLIGSYS